MHHRTTPFAARLSAAAPPPLRWLCVGALLALAGCAASGPSPPDPSTSPRGPHAGATGQVNPPAIISSRPAQDLAAYRQSDEELSESDWRTLEQIGPRASWEQLANVKRRSDLVRQGKPAPAPRDGQPSTAADEVSVTPAGPAPGRAPASPFDALDPAKLPVEIDELPSGKFRLVWTLRHYGGTDVSTTRDAATSRRSVKLATPDLAGLVSALTQQLGAAGTVLPLPRENKLIVACDKADVTPTLQLIDALDVAPPQVEISARIFETSQDFDFQQGAKLILNRLTDEGSQSLVSTFSAKRFLASMAGGAPVQGSAFQLLQAFQDAGISVDVTFQLLAESGLIKVVSAPRMTVSAGQTGYMLAGQEVPIQTASVVNNLLQLTTQYKPVGVQLYVTPQAVGGDQVKLHLITIVSNVSGFALLPTLENDDMSRTIVNPVIDAREAETSVAVGDGDTLVISGMRMVRTLTRENKVPGLGDIPILEWAFKNHRTQQQMTDLYFFVTPRLLTGTAGR